jgi:hypothetical protein
MTQDTTQDIVNLICEAAPYLCFGGDYMPDHLTIADVRRLLDKLENAPCGQETDHNE